MIGRIIMIIIYLLVVLYVYLFVSGIYLYNDDDRCGWYIYIESIWLISLSLSQFSLSAGRLSICTYIISVFTMGYVCVQVERVEVVLVCILKRDIIPIYIYYHFYTDTGEKDELLFTFLISFCNLVHLSLFV